MTFTSLTHFLHLPLLLLSFCLSCCYGKSIEGKHKNITCIDTEREALLKFKGHIDYDYCGLMDSWGDNQDCCTWKGVSCSNRTSHVIGLDLSGGCLQSRVVSPSLSELKHLRSLDLSSNYFSRILIPNFIGSLINLRQLSLSHSGFSGEIPNELANLTRLTSLDLSNNEGLSAKNLNWLSRSTLLKHVNLCRVDLSKATDWSQIIGNLTLIETLEMDLCGLSSPLPSSSLQSPSLRVIPSFIGSLVNLRHLDLSNSGFTGEIPRQLGNLTRLTSLDLSSNEGLSAKSLNWVSELTSLKHINLGSVDLSKATDWSQIIGNLTLIETLEMDLCGLSTPLPSSSLQSPSLRVISLQENAITSLASTFQWLFNTNDPTHLDYLDLSFNSLEGYMPNSVGNLNSLTILDLGFNSLSGTIPDEIGNLTRLSHFDLSHNSIIGDIPSTIGNIESLTYLRLSQNSFSGYLPNIFVNMTSLLVLDFSYNSLRGIMPSTIGNLTSLTYLDFSYNSLKGIIPSIIGNLESLTCLRLSHNSLSCSIPDTIGSLRSLTDLDLSNNSLSGIIPDSIKNLESLERMDLSDNSLSGIIPDSIKNLESLKQMDVSDNSLSGPIAFALQGSSSVFGTMHFLSYLNLSYNILQGLIPSDFLSISYVDLSYNILRGPIPSAFGNNLVLELRYLDLSNNHLEGHIPSEMGDLTNISHIDISNNKLQGPIPSEIGYLYSLSYLNLSNNHLEGVIPSSIVKLDNLGYIDFSNNNLSGSIPCEIEFQQHHYVNFSFNNLSGPIPKYLSYFGVEAIKGNPGLRKEELTMCEEDDHHRNESNDSKEDIIYPGLYVSIGIGLYVGFWGFCGTLTVKNAWRHAYLQFLDHIIDKIYVTVAIYLAKYRRNPQL